MIQNQNNQPNIEQELIKLMDRVDQEIEKITQKLGENDQAIIINGLSGVGKSTIFNWLIGANFIYDKNLKIVDNDNNQYSQINNGPNPVTLNPIISKIQDTNLYLIDLPGMESSDQFLNLYLDLILDKLSKKVSLKGLYILNQPSDDLNEDRQQKFISFVRKYLLHDVNNIEKIILIANKYIGETCVQDFAKNIQDYLVECEGFEKKKPNCVNVIKKINNDQKLKEYFSEEAQKSLINDIIQANQLNIKVSSFDVLEVNKYLSSKIEYFCKIVEGRLENLKNHQKQIRPCDNLREIVFRPYQNEQIDRLSFLLETTQCLVQQNNLEDQFNHNDFDNFAKIYQYFFQVEGAFINKALVMKNLAQSEKLLKDIIESIQQIDLNQLQTQLLSTSINNQEPGSDRQINQQEIQQNSNENADQRQQVAIEISQLQKVDAKSVIIIQTKYGWVSYVGFGLLFASFLGFAFSTSYGLSTAALIAGGICIYYDRKS